MRSSNLLRSNMLDVHIHIWTDLSPRVCCFIFPRSTQSRRIFENTFHCLRWQNVSRQWLMNNVTPYQTEFRFDKISRWLLAYDSTFSRSYRILPKYFVGLSNGMRKVSTVISGGDTLMEVKWRVWFSVFLLTFSWFIKLNESGNFAFFANRWTSLRIHHTPKYGHSLPSNSFFN